MKKTLLILLISFIAVSANEIKDLTRKMIDTHRNNTHIEKKLDKPYEIKGYGETKLNLKIERDTRYLFVKNLNDGKYVYIKFKFKPGNNRSAFNKTRVKIVTKCSTLVNDAYYKDCL